MYTHMIMQVMETQWADRHSRWETCWS